MDELNTNNVLEFWKNATVEQQKENIDRVLELISSDKILDIWKATKKEVKCQNPNLIIKIIKEKQSNGQMYTSGLWRNTPSEVQEQTIEEVMQIYKSGLMLRKIWRETDDSVKAFNKGVLAKALNYDEKLLKEYDIPEYIPAPTGMLGKKEIDDIVWGLMQLPSWEIKPYNRAEAKSMMTEEMPITSIPYFFKQIAEDVPANYIKLFWDSIEKDVQYIVVENVLPQISSKELKMSIWNEFSPEMQKRKIIELLKNEGIRSAIELIVITGNQINKEILEEIINENEPKTYREGIVSAMWMYLPEEIQMEFFQSVMEMYDGMDDFRAYIWQETSEQVQRINFQKNLKTMINDTDKIIEMIHDAKLPRAEIIDYISQEYQGEQLEEIIKGYYLLDVPALEALRGKISAEIGIKLVIKNASELSTEKLEELSKSFNITSIQMQDENDNIGYYQIAPYDCEEYKRCRDTIDELLDGVDLSKDPNNPNREKIIFGEVIKRLANHINYDYVTLEKEENKTATEEESTICRNLVGGLLNKTCVCAGYAEIARNVFSCCGIEVRYISGNNINPEEHGHAWNQIKLDGIWYNMDLTWDRDSIIAEQSTLYLLRSDKDFYGHNQYDIKTCKKEQCSETISYADMKWYLYGKLEIPKPINNSIRRTRRRRVEHAYNMIAASQATSIESPEKREEQWTN